MNMLEIHELSTSSSFPVFHEFLQRYKNGSKTIYGFVEGKDDPCFYRGFIEGLVPNDWNVELWSTNGKDNLIQIHEDINWNSYNKNQVLFFMDKDLSELLCEAVKTDCNIYITDKYSIENSIVNKRTCRRTLLEICNLNGVDLNDLDFVLDLFEKEFESFCFNMINIMAWIVLWKKTGQKPCLNDILMKDLFLFRNGKIVKKSKPKNCNCEIVYIHNQCNIVYQQNQDISDIVQLFHKNKNHNKFVRGKYLFWFMVQFCISIRENYDKFFVSLAKQPKMNITLSHSNAITIIGPRTQCPDSLRKFLKNTCLLFIQSYN